MTTPVAGAALGSAVCELRVCRGLSQEDLGFRSKLHRSYVGALERGAVNPTLHTLVAVAFGLDVELSSLLRLAEERAEDLDMEATTITPDRAPTSAEAVLLKTLGFTHRNQTGWLLPDGSQAQDDGSLAMALEEAFATVEHDAFRSVTDLEQQLHEAGCDSSRPVGRLGRTQILVLRLLASHDQPPTVRRLAEDWPGLTESAVRGALERLGDRRLVDVVGFDDVARTWKLTARGIEIECALNQEDVAEEEA